MSDGSGPLTQAQARALVQRTTDPGWFAGMQDSPDGQAILNAIVAPLAEASNAVMEQVAACAIATAPAGRSGRCDLYLSRQNATAAATIPKGTVFIDSRGVELLVQSDVDIAVGQTNIYVPLVTRRQLDLLNNTEPALDSLYAAGDVIPVVPVERRFIIQAASSLPSYYYDLSMAPSDFWAHVRSDAGDIRVTTAAGVQVAREVSGFDYTGHLGALFIASGGSTSFCVYYGSGEPEPAADSTYGKRAVWETSLLLVAHLEDVTDSSQFLSPMVDHDSVPMVGKLRTGRTLSGASNLWVDTGCFISGDALTIVYWFKGASIQSAVRRQISGYDYVVAGYNGVGKVQHMMINDGDYTDGVYVDGVANNGAVAQDGQWHRCAMVWQRNTANGFRAVFDGVVVDQRNSTDVPIPASSVPADLGHYRGGGENFAGALDEVRIYNRALSNEELAAEYANQSDPATFWTTSVDQFYYASSTPIVGAEADWLSAHGDERGCRRQPGEDGEVYRLRVRAIPNAATPVAIQDAVHGAQAQADLPTVFMVEPMRDQASDASRAEIDLVFADSLFFDEGFLDDPLGVDLPGKLPWRTCEMPSNREARAYFRLGVAGDLLEPDGSVWYWDDGYLDDPAWGFPDVGMHPDLVASLRSVQESARVKVAGGVQFDTYVECVERVDVAWETIGSAWFYTSSPPGIVWLLRDGLLTVTANGGPVNPAVEAYRVGLLLTDGSWILSPVSRACDGMPLRTFELERMGYRGQQVAQIGIGLFNFSTRTMRAVGTFWVTPVTL